MPENIRAMAEKHLSKWVSDKKERGAIANRLLKMNRPKEAFEVANRYAKTAQDYSNAIENHEKLLKHLIKARLSDYNPIIPDPRFGVKSILKETYAHLESMSPENRYHVLHTIFQITEKLPKGKRGDILLWGLPKVTQGLSELPSEHISPATKYLLETTPDMSLRPLVFTPEQEEIDEELTKEDNFISRSRKIDAERGLPLGAKDLEEDAHKYVKERLEPYSKSLKGLHGLSGEQASALLEFWAGKLNALPVKDREYAGEFGSLARAVGELSREETPFVLEALGSLEEMDGMEHPRDVGRSSPGLIRAMAKISKEARPNLWKKMVEWSAGLHPDQKQYFMGSGIRPLLETMKGMESNTIDEAIGVIDKLTLKSTPLERLELLEHGFPSAMERHSMGGKHVSGMAQGLEGVSHSQKLDSLRYGVVPGTDVSQKKMQEIKQGLKKTLEAKVGYHQTGSNARDTVNERKYFVPLNPEPEDVTLRVKAIHDLFLEIEESHPEIKKYINNEVESMDGEIFPISVLNEAGKVFPEESQRKLALMNMDMLKHSLDKYLENPSSDAFEEMWGNATHFYSNIESIIYSKFGTELPEYGTEEHRAYGALSELSLMLEGLGHLKNKAYPEETKELKSKHNALKEFWIGKDLKKVHISERKLKSMKKLIQEAMEQGVSLGGGIKTTEKGDKLHLSVEYMSFPRSKISSTSVDELLKSGCNATWHVSARGLNLKGRIQEKNLNPRSIPTIEIGLEDGRVVAYSVYNDGNGAKAHKIRLLYS